MSASAETLPATSARTQPAAAHSPAQARAQPAAARTPAHARRATRTPAPKHTVHWFRKGLRLHDNPALREGLVDAVTFRCVFLIDPWFASSSNVGINKWRFLLQCLEDLDTSLRKLNSRLFVVRGQPADVLPKLFREWGTTALTFEEDPEPYGRVRDHNIMTKCREVGITVISRVSHTLYKLDNIIERNGGKAPLTYHQFQALIASMPPPLPAEPPISAETLNGAATPVADDHDDRFSVPTLEELGFDTENLKPAMWIGGETEALLRLERHLERKAWVASYGRPKMTPQSLLASQTGLSPYFRFGCLSTRLFYYQLSELYKRIKRVRPPISLHGQILWREFFYCAATRNPNFDRMEGNPICVQIPWEKNQEALAKWANGQTGFPWIDAIMIQLREEGWIHHLARHAVACFLTRGDLWISWEEGMKVFDELLLDADWSVNAGTWMWLSCSSFFQQFFHCYCPVRFGRKTDPNGDYIRRYIPALQNMPTRYIHEPWVAPEAVQQAARCIVGRDYPLPMLDHQQASQLNIQRIKQVYAQLAKYKPHAPVNLQAVQCPNAMQSSPSPTSIIRTINQSNYLCNQTPDSTSTKQQIYKDQSDVFQRPMKTIQESGQTQFKQVAIVQQTQQTNNTTENTDHTTRSAESSIVTEQQDSIYKSHQSTHLQSADKQESYEYKNFNIDMNIYQNQQMNQSEIYNQQDIKKINNYNYDKSKYYLSNYAENSVLVSSALPTLNPQAIQRPNAIESSPSPTSTIKSINQSNYLCSQTPDSTPTKQQTYKDQSGVYQRPIKTIQEPGQTQFKQIVIVQQTQDTNSTTVTECTTRSAEPSTVTEQQDSIYKSHLSTHLQSADKQKTYEYKNFNIDNHIPGYNNQNMYQNQQMNQNGIYNQQDIMKINNYNYDKSKFYLPNYAENTVLVSSASPTFVSPMNRQSNITYNRECKNKTKNNKSEDGVFLHPLNVVSDRIYSGKNQQTQRSNEYNSSSDSSQK